MAPTGTFHLARRASRAAFATPHEPSSMPAAAASASSTSGLA